MSPRNRAIALGLAIGLPLVIALGAWWFKTHERVEEEVDLPPFGEYTYNPLYVLGLSLREAGWTVDMRQRLDGGEVAPGERDTVLLLNDPRRLSTADSQALLDFVEGGGHLIVRTPPPEGLTVEANAPLLEAVGVTLGRSAGCTPLIVEGEDSHVEFCSGRAFDLSTRPAVAWEPDALSGHPVGADGMPDPASAAVGAYPVDRPVDGQADEGETSATAKRAKTLAKTGTDEHANDEGSVRAKLRARREALAAATDVGRYVYARLPHGRGSVDVVAELDFLTNEKLRDAPHVALTRQLFAPNDRAGTAHLLYAAQMPSLWRWLFLHSWMAWLPLLLALFAWLWARMPRFGPLLPSPPAERRSLLEHVRASGDLAWRYGYGHVLHEAVRAAFMARLRRRDPQAAALEGDAQAALIAERFGMTPNDVRDALSTPPARDPAAFRARIATLIRLRNQL